MAAMKPSRDRVLARLRSPLHDSEVADLRRRVEALEQELAEARRHQLRTAELTDVVEALLVPLARRDDAAVERVLRDYTDTLG